MDAISGNEKNAFVRAYGKPESLPRSTVESKIVDSQKVNLTDLSELAQRASDSSTDVRPDAIERAQALLADPNWPSDADLEGLADKLLTTEDFAG